MIEPDDVDDDDLRDSTREDQIEAMKGWFYDRYEDPVHEMPYDSEEGGYFWMGAGPHDALDVLTERFDDVVPRDAIEELAGHLDTECADWVRKEDRDDGYDEYLADAIDSDKHPLETLRGALAKTTALLARLDDEYLRSLALVGVISALEAFLLDYFAKRVLGDDTLFQRYVENEPEFRERKLNLPEIFARQKGLRDEVKKHLREILWHNLSKVTAMYTFAFDIKVPAGLKVIGPAVLKRHDIVHRGGKTHDGDPSVVTKNELATLIETVEKFAIALVDAVDKPPF